MATLQIEQRVSDFTTWKRGFQSGWTLCAARQRGLQSYRVHRALDDPCEVRVDLEFESGQMAESVRDALTELWEAGLAAPAVVGRPQAQVIRR